MRFATEDESWFRCPYPARTMYVRSRSDVTSRVCSGIGTSTVMILIFSWNADLSPESSIKGSEIQLRLFPRRSSVIAFSTEDRIAEKNLS
jgi:hypothetical protein